MVFLSFSRHAVRPLPFNIAQWLTQLLAIYLRISLRISCRLSADLCGLRADLMRIICLYFFLLHIPLLA